MENRVCIFLGTIEDGGCSLIGDNKMAIWYLQPIGRSHIFYVEIEGKWAYTFSVRKRWKIKVDCIAERQSFLGIKGNLKQDEVKEKASSIIGTFAKTTIF